MVEPDFVPLSDWVFSYLSHELRTPLNVLMGFSQMLRNGAYGEVNAVQADRLDRVVHSSELLLRRLDLLLNYQLLHIGQLDLASERVLLSDLLRFVVDASDYDSRGRPLQVILPDEPCDIPLALNRTWGGVALREIVLHAASEALPDPTVRVLLTDGPMHRDGCVSLRVMFSAPPLDSRQQGDLFTVHNRSGIGLPLAMELLALMQGRLDYDCAATRHEIIVTLPCE